MKKVLLAFSACVVLSSCFQKVSDPVSLLEQGKAYLMSQQWQEALSTFQTLQSQDANSCEAAYGILLAEAGIGLDTINTLLNTFFSAFSQDVTLPVFSPPALLPGIHELTVKPSQTSTGPVDSLIQQFFLPFIDQFRRVESAVQRIEELRCTFYLDHYVIDLKVGSFLRIYVDLRGEWSVGEAKLIGAIFDMFTALDYIILSLDLDLNLDPVFQAFLRILLDCTRSDDPLGCIGNFSDNATFSPVVDKLLSFAEGDLITPLRALGFIFSTSPNFLGWHKERFGYFLLVGDEFASALTRFADAFNIFMNRLPEYERIDPDVTDNIVVVSQKQDEFSTVLDDFYINAYNPVDPTVDMGRENVCYNIYISALDEGKTEWCKNYLIDPFLKSIILSASFEKVLNAMYRWSNIFSGRDPDSYITMEDIKELTFGGLIVLPNVIGFRPQVWFQKTPEEFISTVSPPRKWLPYFADMDGDSYDDFVIEGEFPVPDNASYSCSLTGISYGDCWHFPSQFTWYTSQDPIDLRISNDCVEPSSGFLIYMAPQDPSFGGALYINIGSEDFSPLCDVPEENYLRSLGEQFFSPSDDRIGRYAFNKAMARIMQSFSGLFQFVTQSFGGGGF